MDNITNLSFQLDMEFLVQLSWFYSEFFCLVVLLNEGGLCVVDSG